MFFLKSCKFSKDSSETEIWNTVLHIDKYSQSIIHTELNIFVLTFS